MIKVDWSVLLQIFNFVFLVFALNIVLYKPIRNILKQRKEKIADLEGGIDKFDKDVIEKDNAFKAGIRDARAEGLKKKDSMLAEIAVQEKEMIEKINEKAQADLIKAKEQIADDVKSVHVALKGEVDAFADAIGQKFLGRAL
jgi:F-type H+-transporting ATPase subunit b